MAEYPLPKFHFQVEWGGTKIGFSEVTGLEVETYGNLTLKRGVFDGDNQFYEWWNTVKMNTIERRDITISLLNEEHEPVMVWKVRNAWPTKVKSTDLKSDGNEVAIETLELAHEGLTMEMA
jgi:phage tail-like protein